MQSKFLMVDRTGIEPVTPWLRVRCSASWANDPKLVGWVTGIEPATTGATVRYSNQLSYTHHNYAFDKNGAPGGTRTRGLLLRRQLLYPAELQARTSNRLCRSTRAIIAKYGTMSSFLSLFVDFIHDVKLKYYIGWIMLQTVIFYFKKFRLKLIETNWKG